MQRRAAAIYVVFFLVVGAASYSLIATAQQPTIGFENPDHRVSQDQSFDVGDRSYTVTSLTAEFEGGGHGSAPKLTRSGQLAWVDDSAQYTETWDHNTTVTFEDTDYRVVIPDESDPSSFTLREELNKTAILAADDSADDETITRQGEEFVVITDADGTSRLVPADQYFPAPETRSFDEGAVVDYQGNETTFESVSGDAVTLAWTAPQRNTVEVSDRGNVTLNDQTYLAFFPSNETLVLTQNFQDYSDQTASIDQFQKQKNGLWGVTMLSAVTAVLLLGMAYLPSRY